jgi:hypothetical protein
MSHRRFLILMASFTLAILGVFTWVAWVTHPTQAALVTELHVCKTDSVFETIQDAIDAAGPGDVIKVAAGEYLESKMVSGFPYNLYITKTVEIFGGYTCDNWVTRSYTTNLTTILPANPDFAVVTIEGEFGQSASLAPTLDGFTITGAHSNNHGGGLRLIDTDATIRNNTIHDNAAYLLGGGAWVQRGAPLFVNNRIENNRITPSGYGGGIELEGTQATLTGNIISGNVVSSSVGYGGGVSIEGGLVNLVGNTIVGNAAAAYTSTTPKLDVGYGGGVYANYAEVQLTGNLIQNNKANSVFASGFGGAYGYGGGIFITNSPAFTLTDNTILTNTAGYKYNVYLSGGGLEVTYSTGRLINNRIKANYANGNKLFGNGGGLAVYTSTVTIQGGQILNNKAATYYEGYGGGLYAFNSSITVDAVHIENNYAGNTPFYGLGGGLAFVNSPFTLTNSVIDRNYNFNNDAGVGGIYAGQGSPGWIINNTIASNKGQGIRFASAITITNNIILGHTTGISRTLSAPVIPIHNNFYDNITTVRGFNLDSTNIVINPQLDASFHLNSSSPAIDAGFNVYAPFHDFDGEARPMLGTTGLFRFDIGADEFSGLPQVNRDLKTQPADYTLIGPGNPQDNPDSTGSNDWIGFAVLGGDLNGDARDDLVAGAPNLSGDFDGGVNDDGRVFSVYNTGARQLGVTDLYTTTADLEVRSWLHQQHIGRAFAASDIDGDGYQDLIIGSIGGDDNGQPVTGTVYVFAGGSGLTGTRSLSPTMQADYRFISTESTQSFAEANSLAAGQLDGAGPEDLAVGEVNGSAPGNRATAGVVRVFFGSPSLSAIWDTGAVSASLTIYGPTMDAQLGKLALADYNGDTRLDLIARSKNTVYVFFGPLSAGVIDLANASADLTIGGLSGGPLAAGDLNGDGQAEILAGDGENVRVISGDPAVTQATFINVFPSALRAVDWNGDGRGEVVIGEHGRKRVLVLFGGSAWLPSGDAQEQANWIITGEKSTDQFGYSLGSGDLDADGGQDLILGSRAHVLDDRADPDFNDAGAVYIFYGTPGTPVPPPPTYLEIFLPVVKK